MEFDIYTEIISVKDTKGGYFYRVVLTDSSMNKKHVFLSKFTDYQKAEEYCGEIAGILARFGGQYRNQSLKNSLN